MSSEEIKIREINKRDGYRSFKLNEVKPGFNFERINVLNETWEKFNLKPGELTEEYKDVIDGLMIHYNKLPFLYRTKL